MLKNPTVNLNDCINVKMRREYATGPERNLTPATAAANLHVLTSRQQAFKKRFAPFLTIEL